MDLTYQMHLIDNRWNHSVCTVDEIRILRFKHQIQGDIGIFKILRLLSKLCSALYVDALNAYNHRNKKPSWPGVS